MGDLSETPLPPFPRDFDDAPVTPEHGAAYAIAVKIDEPFEDHPRWLMTWFASRSTFDYESCRFGETPTGRLDLPKRHETSAQVNHDYMYATGSGFLELQRGKWKWTARFGCLKKRTKATASDRDKTPHGKLVNAAAKWLRGTMRCSVVIAEMASAADERPDAIGWANGFSVLVECKASHSDFLADSAKPFRAFPESGMGAHRWYFAPPGVIAPQEIPPRWGLAEWDGKAVRRVIEPTQFNPWNTLAEVRHLVSALRRGDSGE